MIKLEDYKDKVVVVVNVASDVVILHNMKIYKIYGQIIKKKV